MAGKPKVLVILTSVDKIPKNGKTIGWYLVSFTRTWMKASEI